MWKRLFILLAVVGSIGMGVLLLCLYSGVEALHQRNDQRLYILQIIEEMRDGSQQLSSLARTRVSTGRIEAERQYQQLIAQRDGLSPRLRNSRVYPGAAKGLWEILEQQPLSGVEREGLNEARDVSRRMRALEQQAMSSVQGLDLRHPVTEEDRTAARDARELLFSDAYRKLGTDVQRLLDSQTQTVLGRMGAEEDSSLYTMALQAMGLCVFLVFTGASLMALGYLGHGGVITKGRTFRRYVGILAMLILSLAVPIWLVYMDARQIMVSTLEKRQAIIGREVYRELYLRVDRGIELAGIMGKLSPVRSYVQQENAGREPTPDQCTSAQEVLDRFTHGYTDIAYTLLLGADGKVLLSSAVGPSSRKLEVLPEGIWRSIREGKSLMTVISAPADHISTLVAVSPVMARDGSDQVVGAVVAAMDRRNSFHLWEERLAVEERMNIFILDKSGAVILSSRGVNRQDKVNPHESVVRMLPEDVQGLRYYTDGQGQERIGYFMPIPELGWTIGVSSVFASTMGSVNAMLIRALVFGTVAILLTIAFFSLLMQSMVRSLRVNSERMNTLVEGMGMYAWEYNMLTGVYSYNPHWHTLMDLPGPPQAGQWSLEKLHAAVHPDDIDDLMACIRGARLGEYIHFDIRHLSYTGHVRHCHVLGYVEQEGADGKKVLSGVAHDITSSRLLALSEEKLRLSSERMTQLMSGAGIHTWDYDELAGSFSYDAQWVRNMRGPEPIHAGTITVQALLGRIHPDFVPLIESLRSKMEIGQYVRFDLRILSYSNEYIWHRSIAKVVAVNGDGMAYAYSGMGYDITAEKSLEESEELLRRQSKNLTETHERMGNLMRALGMYMWEFDMENGNFLYDAQWHRLMELPGTPAGGQWPLEQLFSTAHPDDIATTFKSMESVTEGAFFNFDVRHKTHAGNWLWVRIMARVDKCTVPGKVQHMSGMGYEITAFKVVEQSEANLKALTTELHAAKERMEGIIEAASMFTFEVDIPANVMRYNAQWARFWGLPTGPLPGEMPLSELQGNLHPDSRAAFQHIFMKRSGASFNVDVQVRVHNGEWRWYRQLGRVEEYDAEGQPVRVVGTGFDITAMKMMELSEAEYKQQLEELVAHRTAELEESRNHAQAASQAKTVFLSTVSHEIRTPMNAIVGFAHIFDRSNLTQSQKDHLDKIRLSAETLLGVINDVLDISKIEAGKLELERMPFSLHNMLDTVRSIVDFAAHSKGLKLSVHVADSVPDRLLGDPKRISQILLNLMNNAVKFTMYGNVSLDVTLEDGGSGEDPGPVTLAFNVVDTGIGLSEEQMARLFQPFSQADSSVTRKYGGTGLGLAISKQLVELMGGTIGVASQLDTGSTFRFTLRLDVSTGAEVETEDSGLPSDPEVMERLRVVEGMRVLVAEDNEINQEIARALLEEYGLVVEIAVNGAQALDMASKEKFACIFMDMQMPVMGGLEAASAIRQAGREAEDAGSTDEILCWMAKVPIIAMTANAMSEDKQRCLECGMDDHIGKPIDPFLLQRSLLRWLA